MWKSPLVFTSLKKIMKPMSPSMKSEIITTNNMPDNQIVEVVTKQSAPIIERGNSIVIDSPEAMIEATNILSQVNKAMDQVKDEKEKVLGPLRELANREKARWEPLESIFKPPIESLRNKMSAYQTAALKKKKEEDDKIAARVKEGKGNLKAETAIRKMEENAVETKVVADLGGVSFREKKTLDVFDPKLVPKEYWIIDEDAVLNALKAGTDVPGASIEIVQVPVNKR